MLISTVNLIYAQDTVYFQRQQPVKYGKKNKSGSAEKNIVKLSPLSFISGQIPVFFEREINSFFSIQGGLGITTHNYWEELIDKANDGSTTEFQSITWDDGSTNNTYENLTPSGYSNYRKSKMGTFFSLEPRIYFESEGMDGSYISLTYRNMAYKTAANKIDASGGFSSDPVYLNTTFAESKKMSDILVSFGYQTLYDRISLEYSTGIGLRHLSGEQYVYGYNYNTSKYVEGVGTIDKTKIAFNISLRVGYHF